MPTLGNQVSWAVSAKDLVDGNYSPGVFLLDPEVVDLYVADSGYATSLDQTLARSCVDVDSGTKSVPEVACEQHKA